MIWRNLRIGLWGSSGCEGLGFRMYGKGWGMSVYAGKGSHAYACMDVWW